jgi:hypothetical protein
MKKRWSGVPACSLSEARRTMSGCVQTFLRWHYPGQVQRSVADWPPSQPGSPSPRRSPGALDCHPVFNLAVALSSTRLRTVRTRRAGGNTDDEAIDFT